MNKKWKVNYWMAQAGIIIGANTRHEQGSGNALDEREALPIEAAWDLDNWKLVAAERAVPLYEWICGSEDWYQ